MDSVLARVTAVAERQRPEGSAQGAIDPDADLAGAGFGSLAMVGLLVGVEAEFGIAFPADMIGGAVFRTLRTVAAAVRSLRGDDPAG